MSRGVLVPRELTFRPFVGRDVVSGGVLTRRQLAGGTWNRLFPDVYAWSGLRLDHRVRCDAASLYLGKRGAVSGLSAAYLWGVDVMPRDAPVEVTVPTRLRAPAGMRVVTGPLPAEDLASWAGIPLTTPVRTAFDVARRLRLVEAVVAIDAMLAARQISRASLVAMAEERERWPFVKQLKSVLQLSDAGAESPMESRLRLLMVLGGLPRPVTQFTVRTRGGVFVARLDLAYPAERLGIEYEGDHHRGRGVFQEDLRRQNALRACGWSLLRFAAADIYGDPGRVVTAVRAQLGRARTARRGANRAT
jgi:very-short-patch-repair endonuclease